MITKSYLLNPMLANKVIERIIDEELPMHLQKGIVFTTESGSRLCKVSVDLEEMDLPLLNGIIQEEEEKMYETL